MISLHRDAEKLANFRDRIVTHHGEARGNFQAAPREDALGAAHLRIRTMLIGYGYCCLEKRRQSRIGCNRSGFWAVGDTRHSWTLRCRFTQIADGMESGAVQKAYAEVNTSTAVKEPGKKQRQLAC